MQKTQLGTKRVCPSCGARFYDLAHRPIECPKCKFSFEPDQIVRARKPRAELREVPKRVEDPEVEEVEDEIDEDADEDLLESEEGEEEADPILEEAVEDEAPAKAPRRAKRAPPLEEEDVGVLPDDDEEDEVEVAEDDEDVLAVEDIEDDDLSDIIEDDDVKEEPT